MTKPTDIELVNFFIFNPILGKIEGEEDKKLIYFHPSSHSIDSKMKVVGLSEAIINFMETFTDSPCETMHTLKTKQFYFKPEPDYWMVMTVSVPTQERVVEEVKGVEGRVVVDYMEDQVIDETYQAVLKRIYYMFKMFNGSFYNILSQHNIHDLKLRVDHFCNKYLPTIHFKHCDIMDVFGGLFYLPLDQNSYLKVHSFVNKLECAFPSVQDTMLLYNSQLVWSGLEQEDTKMMFHFLLSSVYPAILEKDFTSTHPMPPSITHPISPSSTQTNPPLSTNPSSTSLTHQNSPLPTHPIPPSTIQDTSLPCTFNPTTQTSQTSTNVIQNPPILSDNSPTTHLSSTNNPTISTTNHPLPLLQSDNALLQYGNIRIGGYTLGPPDLSNPNNIGQIPLVHLPIHPTSISLTHPPLTNNNSNNSKLNLSTGLLSNNSTHPSTHPSNHSSVQTNTNLSSNLCRLLVYKLYDSLICILLRGSEDPSFSLLSQMDAYLSLHMSPLMSAFAATLKKSTSDPTYKYVYYNKVNGAQKTTIHNPHHTTLTTSPHLLHTISSIHQDLNCNAEREDEGCDTMVKVGGGGWVVGRKGEGRELYIVVEQKAANLVAVGDEVKKICSTHFHNLFFTD